jgi:phosphoglycolate phosphatase
MATILFDLDGTLIDSTSLVLPAYRHAIRHFPQYEMPSAETMKRSLGLPDAQIWEVLMPNATPAERQEAYARCEEFIKETMDSTSILMPGAMEVLSELQARGHILTVASNCGESYLNAVLDSQGLRRFFTNPLCLGSVAGRRKADILARHFERFDRNSAVMVGDRRTDVEAAEEHGVPCIGCAFGFGSEDELQGAAVIIRSLPELLPLFPAGASTLFLPHGRR